MCVFPQELFVSPTLCVLAPACEAGHAAASTPVVAWASSFVDR